MAREDVGSKILNSFNVFIDIAGGVEPDDFRVGAVAGLLRGLLLRDSIHPDVRNS
jgi:hypothetical protein